LDSKIDQYALNTKDRVQISGKAADKKITAVRYIDIEDAEGTGADEVAEGNYNDGSHSVVQAPPVVARSIENYAATRGESTQEIQQELANLKRLVEELRRERLAQSFVDVNAPYMVTESLQSAFEILIHSGLERRLAIQFMRDAAMALDPSGRADHDRVLDAVARTLVDGIEVVPFFPEASKRNQGSSIVAFIGMSGVGKTAMLAKLATHATRKRNERVALVRLQDNANEETVDPLSILSKALHVPYRVVQGADALAIALEDLNNFDWVFIDTPSVGIRDRAMQNRIESILHSDAKIRIELVASASTREIELGEIAKCFAKFRPEALIFTKLDESLAFGGMISLAQRMKLPICAFGTGKKVTEDWEEASPERIVAEVLDI